MTYFPYSETQTAYLKAHDHMLGAVIDNAGHLYRELHPHLFTALIHAILGQQISTKAHETIWKRAVAAYAPMSPDHLSTMDIDEIRAVGISARKADYIRVIAQTIQNGEISLDTLHTLSDKAVCDALSALKGVGVWTAEMLMIFSMARPDILSFADLGIIRGMKMVYGYETVTKEIFQKHKALYSPYATTASLYLWAVSKGEVSVPDIEQP